MFPGNDKVLTAFLAIAAILILMGFSILCFITGNPALGGTAGTVAVALIGFTVRLLLKAAFPATQDDVPPSAEDQPSEVEVQ